MTILNLLEMDDLWPISAAAVLRLRICIRVRAAFSHEL